MLSGDSYLISTSITRIVGGGTGLKSGKHFGSESDTVRAVLCAWIEKSQVVTNQMQYCESTLTLISSGNCWMPVRENLNVRLMRWLCSH